MWSSVVFYQTPGLEVTACMLLSTKAVYFVLHDGLRRHFSEPLQGRHRAAAAGSRSLCPRDGPAVWPQPAVPRLHWTENLLGVGVKQAPPTLS